MCCPDLKMLFINCKPFYSPFILVSVYIPPQGYVSSALQKLADQITDKEQKHWDSVLIILGHLNKANLSRELLKYRHHVTCPIRYSKTLDHCYTAIKMYIILSHRQLLGSLITVWFILYQPTGTN